MSKKLNLTIEKQVVTDTYLQYIFKEELKVEFVKDVPVHFGDFKMEGKVRLDSLENIGSNKVLAIFGRTAAKDFVDLYFILKNTPFTLDHLFKLAAKKDLGLTEFYLANSMNRIQEAGEYPTLLVPFDRGKMVKLFQDLAHKLLLKIKPQE
jgi:predicted nucleotidyltransferase component of viral defense system